MPYDVEVADDSELPKQRVRCSLIYQELFGCAKGLGPFGGKHLPFFLGTVVATGLSKEAIKLWDHFVPEGRDPELHRGYIIVNREIIQLSSISSLLV